MTQTFQCKLPTDLANFLSLTLSHFIKLKPMCKQLAVSEQANTVFSREHFVLKEEDNVFCFWRNIQLFSNYLKTNDICITVDDFFHDSLFSVLPIECPRWAVAIELPGGVFIAQHVVTHNCEWSWKERKKGKGHQPLKITNVELIQAKILNLTWSILEGLLNTSQWAYCTERFVSRSEKRPCWAGSYHVRLKSAWKKISVTTKTRRRRVRNKAMQSHCAANSLLTLRTGEI